MTIRTSPPVDVYHGSFIIIADLLLGTFYAETCQCPPGPQTEVFEYCRQTDKAEAKNHTCGPGLGYQGYLILE